MVKDFLAQLNKEFGFAITPLPGEGKGFMLSVPPRCSLVVGDLSQGFFLRAGVALLTKDQNKSTLFLSLMKANLFGQGTGGGAFGLDLEEKQVFLLWFIPQVSGYEFFKDCIESFANSVDFWKEELELMQDTKAGQSLL